MARSTNIEASSLGAGAFAPADEENVWRGYADNIKAASELLWWLQEMQSDPTLALARYVQSTTQKKALKGRIAPHYRGDSRASRTINDAVSRGMKPLLSTVHSDYPLWLQST